MASLFSDVAPVANGPKSSSMLEAPKPVAAPASPGTKVKQRQHCRCGACKWCIDNARWDRIFNEKFVDHTYYATLPMRRSSSLAGAR